MNTSQQILTLFQSQQEKQWRYIPFFKVECFWKIGKLLFATYWEIIHEEQVFRKALQLLFPAKQQQPDVVSLQKMTQFYTAFPDYNKLSPLLSWSHYLELLKISDKSRRNYYYQEAVNERWTLAALQNAITNQQFKRTQPLVKQNQSLQTIHAKTYFQFSFLKKFAGKKIPERALETALIEQLQTFLNELGKGFAFVARQKRLITPNGKQLFIDLLFYNYLLHRFVLIDLKIVPLNYEHIGQMDTYCRLFNETTPLPEKPPCLGIILCPKIDASLLHYSLLKNHPTLFAFEYTLDQMSPQKHQQRMAQKNWEHGLFEKFQ